MNSRSNRDNSRTPGGIPPTSRLYNNHGINDILGQFTFRTMNDTYIGQIVPNSSSRKILILNEIVMVEAAGVGLLDRFENKHVIDSKGPLETEETANTRF